MANREVGSDESARRQKMVHLAAAGLPGRDRHHSLPHLSPDRFSVLFEGAQPNSSSLGRAGPAGIRSGYMAGISEVAFGFAPDRSRNSSFSQQPVVSDWPFLLC